MDILGFLKGYKSVIGCVGAIATFIVVVCTALADGFQMGDTTVILAGFSAMMLALGWTGKLQNMEKAAGK